MAVCPTTSVVHVTTCLSTLQDATGAINEVSLPQWVFSSAEPKPPSPRNSPSNTVAALVFQLKRDNCSVKESS